MFGEKQEVTGFPEEDENGAVCKGQRGAWLFGETQLPAFLCLPGLAGAECETPSSCGWSLWCTEWRRQGALLGG